MKLKGGKRIEDYITEKEAQKITDYKRGALYKLRTAGKVRWTAAESGRKVRYHKTF